MGGGMMGGQGQAAGAQIPVQQMADVMKRMADRLASDRKLDRAKAEKLRALAADLVEATSRMSGGMGGGMGGGMMGQGSAQMAEVSRIVGQMAELLRGE